jgi:MoxR-like ATPase
MTLAVAEQIDRLRKNINRVFVGKAEVTETVLIGLLAEGNLLIEDLPGVGKTVLAKALARSIDCNFSRIQFTPDLLPSDILGVSIYNAARGEFTFKPGPIFSNVVLADEINRATPRTQSSLLEAMNEGHVTVDGVTHPLAKPFLVIATQNPLEYEGTFPLPESQLDRFLMRIRIGYPNRDQERRILVEQKLVHPLESLKPTLTGADVVALQHRVREAKVEPPVMDYVLEIIARTRQDEGLELGASPRAALNLTRAAQARAVLQDRDYTLPDDVKRLAEPVLLHRLVAKTGIGDSRNGNVSQVLRHILNTVAVPL